MAIAGRIQVKAYLTKEAHAVLRENKALTGATISDAIEDFVWEVLKPEVDEARAKKAPGPPTK